MFTMRSAVLVLVTLMGFILVTPTVLQYLKQRNANDELAAQLAQIQEQNEQAQNEYNRWQDDKFVIAQARERLTFVFPGETSYHVIDPEVATEPTAPPSPEPIGEGAVTDRLTADQPWYSSVWESVELAGTAN